MKNFDESPTIKNYVNEHFPIYDHGYGYIIYDLAHPIK
jgi:hypothetical protein